MSAKMPHGWRYEPASTKACLYCQGTGRVPCHARMISPTGVVQELFGRATAAFARQYVEIWAPERCSPTKRRELYGDGKESAPEDPSPGAPEGLSTLLDQPQPIPSTPLGGSEQEE